MTLSDSIDDLKITNEPTTDIVLDEDITPNLPLASGLPITHIGWIRVNNHIYNVLEVLSSSPGFLGRGTIVYLVHHEGHTYIIKDHWIEQPENKVAMMGLVSRIQGVPKVVEHWQVEISEGIINRTSHYRDERECKKMKGGDRIHVCIVISPCGRPLTQFRTKCELVQSVRDVLNIQKEADASGILHCNTSPSNLLIKDYEGGVRGMLINWGFAVQKTYIEKYSVGGTGTIPFLLRSLLKQIAHALQEHQAKKVYTDNHITSVVLKPRKDFTVHHMSQDNLESLFYVLFWIMTLYDGPGSQEQEDFNFESSILAQWTESVIHSNLEAAKDSNSDNGQFGFRAPASIVPPGSELDLEALNNPYIAEQRVKELQIAAQYHNQHLIAPPTLQHSVSSASGSLLYVSVAMSQSNQACPVPTSQLGPKATNFHEDPAQHFYHKLDPSLRSQSIARETRGVNESSESCEEDESGADVEDAEDGGNNIQSDEDRDPARHYRTGFHSEIQASQVVHHASLPPDHEFTWSCDEDDGNAATLLGGDDHHKPSISQSQPPISQSQPPISQSQAVDVLEHQLPIDQSQTVDVLEGHQRRNGRPRAPDPAVLTALQPAAPHGESANSNPLDTSPPVCCCRQQAHDQASPANQIGHHSLVWKDCLEAAKVECRAVHALANPWPKKQMDLENSIMDSLTTVVMQWTQCGVHFKLGFWPEKKMYMAVMVCRPSFLN
ncbi:hypothetical protein OG21DRAFT_1490167 [Imleria badia]|nr:hypothetical protein OG21DRAFT_1490167 [Imleria badia]